MQTIVPFSRKAEYPKYPPERYSIRAAGTHATVVLYGVVGDPYEGISAKQVFTDLQAVASAKTMDIHINSPGGLVSDGVAIANRLLAHPARKTVCVDSEASSIAAYIAMAGDEVIMGEGSMMLVHRAWALTIGNTLDHEKMIADLRKWDESQVQAYAKRTGMKPAAVLSLMDENRYMDAAEAVQLGFADQVASGGRIAAMAVDRSALHLPSLPRQRAAGTAAFARLRAAIR